MRFLPIVAAAAIGMFATAATAQNMNTSDPNSAPGASSTGKGKVMAPTATQNKMNNTMDPNSAPGASAKGGNGMTTGQSMAKDPAASANTKDPNSTPDMPKKKMKMSKKHKKMMKKDM
jgi:hypothetical protein